MDPINMREPKNFLGMPQHLHKNPVEVRWNEAAERLVNVAGRGPAAYETLFRGWLKDALAAERRATVERLVGAIPTMEWVNFPDSVIAAFRGEGWPFDEEAGR